MNTDKKKKTTKTSHATEMANRKFLLIFLQRKMFILFKIFRKFLDQLYPRFLFLLSIDGVDLVSLYTR